MVKKIKKYAKFIVCMALIMGLIAPSYAALSASDGSAFVTKAEFDSALADFNARLTTFEAGINSKIDSQVTSYLDRNGIWNGKEQTWDTWDPIKTGKKSVSYGGVWPDKIATLPHDAIYYETHVDDLDGKGIWLSKDGYHVYKTNTFSAIGLQLWGFASSQSGYAAAALNPDAVIGSTNTYMTSEYGTSTFYQWANILTGVGPSFTANKSGMAVINMNVVSGSMIYHIALQPKSAPNFFYGFAESIYWSDEFVYGDNQKKYKAGMMPTNVMSLVFSNSFNFRMRNYDNLDNYLSKNVWFQYSSEHDSYFKDYQTAPEATENGTIMVQTPPNAFGSAPGNYVTQFFVQKGKTYQLHRAMVIMNNQFSIGGIKLVRGREERVQDMSVSVY